MVVTSKVGEVVSTPSILSSRPGAFWVHIDDGLVQFGRGDTFGENAIASQLIISNEDLYVGVITAGGVNSLSQSRWQVCHEGWGWERASGIQYEIPSFDTQSKYIMRWRGSVNLNASGAYTFRTRSGDGSRVYINKTLMVDNDGHHAMQTNAGPPTMLNAGWHDIVVTYFRDLGRERPRIVPGTPMSDSTSYL